MTKREVDPTAALRAARRQVDELEHQTVNKLLPELEDRLARRVSESWNELDRTVVPRLAAAGMSSADIAQALGRPVEWIETVLEGQR